MARAKAWFREEVKREKFLTAIWSGATVLQACDAAKWSFALVDGWLRDDETIRLEVERAKEFVGAVEASREQDKPAVIPNASGEGRWRFIRGDAEKWGGGMFGTLMAIDSRLVSKKLKPPMSDFCVDMMREFYAGGYSELCLVAGRGFGKSTLQITIAANELIFRDRDKPAIDPAWIWPFMSHTLAESDQRYQPFKDTLLGIGYQDSDLICHRLNMGRSSIEFEDAKGQRVKVNVFPNSAEALRGPNLAGATDDEELHWQASEKDGVVMSRADELLETMVNGFRADSTRVHIRISSANDLGGAMMDAAEEGTTALRFVPTLGKYLQRALDGFERVALLLDATGRDGAKRIRAWAATLTEHSPWIPTWVGNPTHDAVKGFELMWSKIKKGRDKIGIWLRENGSSHWPLEFVAGGYFEDEVIDRACATLPARTRERGEFFAAIDTGSSKNPSALCIVERVVHAVNGERRYQFRPVRLVERRRKPGGLPLDLRNDVIPEFARIVLAYGCSSWWSDGWSLHDIENGAVPLGITTKCISTSTVSRDQYEPLDAALAHEPCPIVLSGCDNIEAAVAQLRQVRRDNTGKAIVPKVGTDHGELGQVLVRALAHAGIGTMPPDDDLGWRSWRSSRIDDE